MKNKFLFSLLLNVILVSCVTIPRTDKKTKTIGDTIKKQNDIFSINLESFSRDQNDTLINLIDTFEEIINSPRLQRKTMHDFTKDCYPAREDLSSIPFMDREVFRHNNIRGSSDHLPLSEKNSETLNTNNSLTKTKTSKMKKTTNVATQAIPPVTDMKPKPGTAKPSGRGVGKGGKATSPTDGGSLKPRGGKVKKGM